MDLTRLGKLKKDDDDDDPEQDQPITDLTLMGKLGLQGAEQHLGKGDLAQLNLSLTEAQKKKQGAASMNQTIGQRFLPKMKPNYGKRAMEKQMMELRSLLPKLC